MPATSMFGYSHSVLVFDAIYTKDDLYASKVAAFADYF